MYLISILGGAQFVYCRKATLRKLSNHSLITCNMSYLTKNNVSHCRVILVKLRGFYCTYSICGKERVSYGNAYSDTLKGHVCDAMEVERNYLI